MAGGNSSMLVSKRFDALFFDALLFLSGLATIVIFERFCDIPLPL